MVIPPPSGFTITTAAGINNSGQVAGTGTNGSVTQAFVGSPSGSTLIPLPAGWTGSLGTALNASGAVTGTLTAPPDLRDGFIGTPSGATLLPQPQSQLYYGSFATAINDSNQVGEIGLGLFGNSAYLTTASASIPVVGPYPYGGGMGSAQAVNQSGQVAGFEVFTGSDFDDVYVFFGGPAGTVLVPPPPGTLSFAVLPGNSSSALGMNDVGQIAVTGRAGIQLVYRGVLPLLEIQQAAFGTAAGTAFLPPPPPGASGWTSSVGPQSINNSAVVVGVGDSPTRTGGWIWDATNGTRLLEHSGAGGMERFRRQSASATMG